MFVQNRENFIRFFTDKFCRNWPQSMPVRMCQAGQIAFDTKK